MAVDAENEGTNRLLTTNRTALTDCGFCQDILINERYRIDYKIGEGGFGLVYAGTLVFDASPRCISPNVSRNRYTI